ncbi:hypothetical protein FRC08_009828 [Ceratobasidium sp. 394]|nr:hypothetical protein FRC08_009828 [Ceratobasidium sp. 394]
MPSLGGFYLSPTAWSDWICSQDHTYERWGGPTAEVMIARKMSEKNIRALFGIDLVPIPRGEPQERNWGLMIYRRKNKRQRVYLPPRDESEADREAKRMLEELIGLKVLEWTTVWYDPNSETGLSEFLEPLEKGDKS